MEGSAAIKQGPSANRKHTFFFGLVGFHPATRGVQSTPAYNTRKRVWQYIEKERKQEKKSFSSHQKSELNSKTIG